MNPPSIDGLRPDEIKQVPDFPRYWVTIDGRVFGPSGKWIQGSKDKRPGKGHRKVQLWRVITSILVASIFLFWRRLSDQDPKEWNADT